MTFINISKSLFSNIIAQQIALNKAITKHNLLTYNNAPQYLEFSSFDSQPCHFLYIFQHIVPWISYVSFIFTLTFVVSFAIGLGKLNYFYSTYGTNLHKLLCTYFRPRGIRRIRINRSLNFNPLSTKISNKIFRFIGTLSFVSSFLCIHI